MTLQEVARRRLINQHIAEPHFHSVKEVVHWMGAMQAQDYAMSKWAIGIRLPGSTETSIEAAIDKAEIIRTHLLRPTWHWVIKDDIYWMLKLSAPKIKASAKARHKELELTESVLNKSNQIIEKALVGNNHLTREELMAILADAGIRTNDNRSSHIMLNAELDGLVCSGIGRNKKHTYALLEERVPTVNNLNKEEALAALALRYFGSHGPATFKDFSWWSGLSAPEARKAFEIVKPSLVSESIGTQTFWMRASSDISDKACKSSTLLLPAYDEFIISYADRSAALSTENQKKAISINGFFKPVIVVNGQITGLWKRTIKKDKIFIEADLFKPHNKELRNLIAQACGSFGQFLNKEPEVCYAPEQRNLIL
ncbi:MAG TPA: winged helix DNA-binding domain-containing protein [Daejeonella sp.]|nr:winged helix DNA-binding domain-containing protein [Daejeonella sp.]